MPSESDNARVVGDAELVGMLYYNRGIQLLEAGHFAEAVDANLCALACDAKSTIAYDNLLAVLNNWALHRCEQREFDESLRLLELGLAIEPDSERLLANRVYLHDRWAAALVEQGKHGEAVALLRQSAKKWPDEPFYARKAEWLEAQAGYLPQ